MVMSRKHTIIYEILIFMLNKNILSQKKTKQSQNVWYQFVAVHDHDHVNTADNACQANLPCYFATHLSLQNVDSISKGITTLTYSQVVSITLVKDWRHSTCTTVNTLPPFLKFFLLFLYAASKYSATVFFFKDLSN